MSLQCLNCCEAWDLEDYTCPCCGGATVDADSEMEPTLRYTFEGADGNPVSPHNENPSFEHNGEKVNFVYDVIRIETGKSIFDEPKNYLNDSN